jgi:hypothetical protein
MMEMAQNCKSNIEGKRCKAQSAMEYLMTYGWAILIIGITLSVLFEMGLFKPNTYVTNLCVLPSGFGCNPDSLTTGGTLTLTIKNALNDPINITAIGCSKNETFLNMQTPNNPPSNQIYLPIGGTSTISVSCQGAPSHAGSLYKGYVIINYTDDVTGFPQTIYGSVVIKAT